MSEPVNQINHAEVIRDYLEDPMMSAGPSKALASLAALQKELEEAKTSDTESISLYRNCRDRADAQAERIARLEEALAECSCECASMWGFTCPRCFALSQSPTPPTP